MGWPDSIVGAERLCSETREAIVDMARASPRQIKFQTYDEWAAPFGSLANPAPETTAEHYRWSIMLRWDREWEECRADAKTWRRGCVTGRWLW
jgi:hypothetical protein